MCENRRMFFEKKNVYLPLSLAPSPRRPPHSSAIDWTVARGEISRGEIELNQSLTAAGIYQRQLRCVNGARASRTLSPSSFVTFFLAVRSRSLHGSTPPSTLVAYMLMAAYYYDSKPTRNPRRRESRTARHAARLISITPLVRARRAFFSPFSLSCSPSPFPTPFLACLRVILCTHSSPADYYRRALLD